MKLAPQRLAQWIAAPDASLRAALVFGVDAGLVAERAERIARAIVADPKDAFRIGELSALALSADPALLFDEAAALSLTGGRRLVRVRDAGDALGNLFQRFLADPPPGDSLVLVEAGALAQRSSLRRAFEAAKSAAAIPCYADGPRELAELVREVMAPRRIEVTSDAQAYLVAHLGSDRMVSRQELDKLALMVGDGGRIDEQVAAQSVGDAAGLDLDDVAYAAADGDAAALERALERVFAEGEAPVSVLRALMRHFQRLHLAGSRLAAGIDAEEALRSLRPPVFFAAKERFKRALRLWPPNRALAVLAALTEAERNAKRSVLPQEIVCRDALLRIARRAATPR